MNEFKKSKKNLKNDMLVLFIFEIIILVASIIVKEYNSFTIIFSLLFFIGFLKAKDGKKIAGTIGIITGILMMLTIFTLDLIDVLLGLFVLLHSIKYNKSYIKK